jgi:hypothetical protein
MIYISSRLYDLASTWLGWRLKEAGVAALQRRILGDESAGQLPEFSTNFAFRRGSTTQGCVSLNMRALVKKVISLAHAPISNGNVRGRARR